MSLDLKAFDVTAAVCGCPAGKGPSASCKHIGAPCYVLVEFAPHSNFLNGIAEFKCPYSKRG